MARTRVELRGAPGVVLPESVVCGLVSFALDKLWVQQQQVLQPGGEDDDAACCSSCCAPCASLRALYFDGRLGQLVLPHDRSATCAWWDPVENEVSLEFLDASWGWRMSCCDDSAGAIAPVRAPYCWAPRMIPFALSPADPGR